MTIVTFASVKGAPGVTTVACLVGATWPAERRVMVAECDPSGGDLAARFELSSKRGWATFATALRRSGERAEIEPHLQQLPGGLDVLVGPGGFDGPAGTRVDEELRVRTSDPSVGPWDVLADIGRLPEGDLHSSGWLAKADSVVILLRNDATSILHVRNRAREIRTVCGDRAALAVVGGTRYGNDEIAEFIGLPVIGNVPFDPVAAAVAAGGQGSERRLSRSFLINSALRLSQSLCPPASGPLGIGDRSTGQALETKEPVIRMEQVRRYVSWWGRKLDRLLPLFGRQVGARGQASAPLPVPVPEQLVELEQRPESHEGVSA